MTGWIVVVHLVPSPGPMPNNAEIEIALDRHTDKIGCRVDFLSFSVILHAEIRSTYHVHRKPNRDL